MICPQCNVDFEIPYSLENCAKYCFNTNPDIVIWKSLEEKQKADPTRWQQFNTPTKICNQMVEMYKKEFNPNDKILILFNLEFIQALALNYKNLIYRNIYFITDCEKDFYWVKENKFKINIIKLEKFDVDNLSKHIKEFNVKKFDIVFSNPPYNQSSDLKILMSIKNLFSEAIIVHPSIWLIETKNTRTFKKMKELYKTNVKSVKIFRGSKVFNVPFMSSLVITYFNNNKITEEVDVDDQVVNSKYVSPDILNITQFGDMWFKLNIKEFNDSLKKYPSMLDSNIRCKKGFHNESWLKYPMRLPVLRSGNPHFNDGYFDEKFGYYVLNKSNYFFTCIAKGDPNKYHFVKEEKDSTLCFNFNTANERQNFYDYCKTKVFRFILSIRKVNGNLDRDEFRNTPWLDFNKHWTDKDLCEEFKINKDLWNYINNFIPDCYDDYNSGFVE